MNLCIISSVFLKASIRQHIRIWSKLWVHSCATLMLKTPNRCLLVFYVSTRWIQLWNSICIFKVYAWKQVSIDCFLFGSNCGSLRYHCDVGSFLIVNVWILRSWGCGDCLLFLEPLCILHSISLNIYLLSVSWIAFRTF